MDSERELKSHDLSSTAATAFGTVAMNQAAKGGPRWLRWIVGAFTVIIVVVTGAGLLDKLSSIGSLPKCDAQRTRDTLSDLNKAQKVNASQYNFIKNVRTTDLEVLCTANLALREGGTLEYDFRIYKEAGSVKVQITDFRRH